MSIPRLLILAMLACSCARSRVIDTRVTTASAVTVTSSSSETSAAQLTLLSYVTLQDGRHADVVDGRRVVFEDGAPPTVVPGPVELGRRVWSVDARFGGGFLFRTLRRAAAGQETDGPEIWRAERFDGELSKVAIWERGGDRGMTFDRVTREVLTTSDAGRTWHRGVTIPRGFSVAGTHENDRWMGICRAHYCIVGNVAVAW